MEGSSYTDTLNYSKLHNVTKALSLIPSDLHFLLGSMEGRRDQVWETCDGGFKLLGYIKLAYSWHDRGMRQGPW